MCKICHLLPNPSPLPTSPPCTYLNRNEHTRSYIHTPIMTTKVVQHVASTGPFTWFLVTQTLAHSAPATWVFILFSENAKLIRTLRFTISCSFLSFKFSSNITWSERPSLPPHSITEDHCFCFSRALTTTWNDVHCLAPMTRVYAPWAHGPCLPFSLSLSQRIEESLTHGKLSINVW